MFDLTRSPVPARTMAVLAASVLAVHLWLLYAAPPRPLPIASPVASPVAPAGAAVASWRVSLAPVPEVPPTASKAPPAATPKTPPTAVAAAVTPVFKPNPPQALVQTGDSATNSEAITSDQSPLDAPAMRMVSASTADTAAAQSAAPAADAPDDSSEAPISPALAAQVAALANARVKVPGEVRLNYKIEGKAKGFGFGGKGHLVWRPGAGGDPAAYEAQLVVGNALLGSRSQTSSGRLTSHGLAPTRFADKARSEQAAHFVRDKGHIVFSANAPQAVLLPGAQDRLSVVLQLSSLLAGNPGRFTAGRTLAIQTAGAKDAEVWQFLVVGEETLGLPGGELRTLKLMRKPRHAYDQQIELWFAEKLGFLPARIKLSQVGGNMVDQSWESSETP